MNPVWKKASALLVIGLPAIALITSPKLPRDQALRIVLGECAPHVHNLRIGIAEADSPDESLREIAFNYPNGDAARATTTTFRLADGAYTIEVEVVVDGEIHSIRRQATLMSNQTTIISLNEGGSAIACPLAVR